MHFKNGVTNYHRCNDGANIIIIKYIYSVTTTALEAYDFMLDGTRWY